MANKEGKAGSRELSHWLVRELNFACNVLDELDNQRDFAETDPELWDLMCHLGNVLDWMETRHNLLDKSEGFDRIKEFVEFRDQEESLMCDRCGDCGVEDIDWFMVKDELWDKHGFGMGLLCRSCLEKRVGRVLAADDFTDCALNDGNNAVRALRGLPPLEDEDEVPARVLAGAPSLPN